MSRPCVALLAVSLALAVTAAPLADARADQPTCTETPSDAEVRQRLRSIETIVRNEEPAVRRWWSSFALLHGSMLVGTLLLAISATDEGYRNEMIVSMTSSTLALATLAIFTPAMLGAGDSLRGRPEGTPEERLARMRAGEDILRRSAQGVDFMRSYVPATLSVAYVAAASGTLLLALERNTGAFTHSIGGTILGLARVLLYPSASRDAWRRYARAYAEAGCVVREEDPALARLPEPSWQVSPAGIGLGLTVTF